MKAKAWQLKIQKHPQILYILAGIGISLVVVLPYFFQGGIYNQDDFPFHKLRLESYYQAVSAGDFFPKIFPEMANGYGYAADLFYPSILLLPYALLRSMGLSFVTAYLGYQFLITCGTFFSSFYCLKKISKESPCAFLFATFYVTATYRLLDQFIRGALGETLSFLFLPFLLLGIHQIFIEKKGQYAGLVIGMTGLLMAHFITAYAAFWFLLGTFLYFLLKKQITWEILCSLVKATLLTSLLAAWILLPIYEQSQNLTFNFSNQPKLWSIGLNFSMSDLFLNSLANAATNWSDLKPGIGLFFLIIFIIGLLTWRKNVSHIRQLTLVSGLFLLLSTNFFPWSYLRESLFALIQFPWRLLTFASLFLAWLAAELSLKYFKKWPVAIAVALFLTIAYSGNTLYAFKAKNVDLVTNENYATFQTNALGGGAEYLPVGTDYRAIQNDQTRELVLSGDASVENYQNNRDEIQFDIQTDQTLTLVFPRIAYVGYEVLVDETAEDLFISDGKVALKITPGTHKVVLKYSGTNLQQKSLLVSILIYVMLISTYILKIIKLKKASSLET